MLFLGSVFVYCIKCILMSQMRKKTLRDCAKILSKTAEDFGILQIDFRVTCVYTV